MPEKDPTTYAWLTWAWVTILSSWGGLVSFMRKYRQGDVRAFNITELLGELLTSSFSGIITFMLCESAGIDPLATAAMVGISGHMGSRAIFLLERFAESRLTGLPPINKDQEK